MCCYKDKAVEKEVMARFGKRKTAVFWKGLTREGSAVNGGHQYKPGVNMAKGLRKRYDTNRPRGMHVYLETPDDVWDEDSDEDSDFVSLPVVCHRDDFMRAGDSHNYDKLKQAVFRKVTIRKADWEAAGFTRKDKA